MSLMTHEEEQLLRDVVAAIQTLPNGLRQARYDELWARNADPVIEGQWNAAQPANTPLPVFAQTQGYELIEQVVISLPPGSTGVLSLGSFILPVLAGVTSFSVGLILGTSDTRSLVTTVTGPTALWITGRQQPTFGKLSL